MEYFKQILCSDPESNPEPSSDSTMIPMDAAFSQLGGDSLAAMRLSGLIREHLNADVTVEIILKQPLREALEVITQCLTTHHNPSGVKDSNQKGTLIQWGEEVSLEGLELEACVQLSQRDRKGDEGLSVFLTGATGFLGRFILLELLQNQQCDRIYCLVQNKEGGCMFAVFALICYLLPQPWTILLYPCQAGYKTRCIISIP